MYEFWNFCCQYYCDVDFRDLDFLQVNIDGGSYIWIAEKDIKTQWLIDLSIQYF